MGHNKMNGHAAPSLDVRISSALASDVADKSALTALLAEAEAALAEAQRTIETETANALDINNTDPDASDEQVRKAQRTSARLTIAIPKLRERLKAIELFEYNQSWHAQADAVEARGDKSAERLKHYAKVIVWLQAEFAEIDSINSEIHALHLRAPAGENRRLLEPELIARGLDHYDAKHPRLREQLKLPKWDRSSEIAFPMDPMDQWNRQAALANEALTRRMTEKFSLTTGPDWAAGRALQIDHETAEFRKRDAELKAKEAESKRLYEEGLKQGR